MSPRVVLWWIAAGLVGCVAYVLTASGSIASTVVYQLAAIPATIVLLTAVLRMPARSRPVWWAVFGYAAFSVIGDAAYDVQLRVLDDPPYPGFAELAYLAGYACAAVALALLIRRFHRGPDLEAWIDTAILSLAAASAVGVLIIAPLLSEGDSSGTAAAIAVAYPFIDIVLLAGLARLLVGPARINASIALLCGAFAITLFADLVYSFFTARGLEESVPPWLNALYLAAFIAMAGAANSRGATSFTGRTLRANDATAPVRILGLSLGALIVPVILLYLAWSDGMFEVALLTGACVLVLLLILSRLRLLLDVVEQQAVALTSLARTDALTDLPNRRTLDAELERLDARGPSTGSFTIAMMDLDHFKAYNDVNGHQAGDDALVACAQAWKQMLARLAPGEGVFIARYGGEEFAVLLPERGLATSEPLLERLRAATPEAHTVSIGFAERRPGESGFETMSRADQALYRAKQLGRNRAVHYRSEDVTPSS